MEVAPLQDPGPVPAAAPPQASAAPTAAVPAAPAAPVANKNPSSKAAGAGGGEVGTAGSAGTGAGSAPAAVAGGKAEEDASVSWNDIKSVQNLIERCLQKFMTQTEIIAALQVCCCDLLRVYRLSVMVLL